MGQRRDAGTRGAEQTVRPTGVIAVANLCVQS